MTLSTQIQQCSECRQVPDTEHISLWADAAFSSAAGKDAAVTIRIVDREEGAELNHKFRNREEATNVLSFAYADGPLEAPGLLGDIVICAPIVQQEALEQKKILDAHWAHMVVHGVLHLCGYDHIDEKDACAMEQLETDILYRLGFPEPYTKEPVRE
jgi:probable rRNA maturation factor